MFVTLIIKEIIGIAPLLNKCPTYLDLPEDFVVYELVRNYTQKNIR